MHGDEGLMVHFSEPEMQPSEGSSKKHWWQVRTLAAGAWHREQRRRSQEPSQAHPGPAPPLLPDPGRTYPSPSPSLPWSAPPGAHGPSLWNFRGEERLPRSTPKPHLPGITLLNLQPQNRESEQKLLWVQSCLRQDPDQKSSGRKNGLSSPTLSGSCAGHSQISIRSSSS